MYLRAFDKGRTIRPDPPASDECLQEIAHKKLLHRYQNYSESSQQIKWFWEILEEFTEEQRAWFLQFVTGTSQVPLEGFKALVGMRGPQKFSIHRAHSTERLPTAHTCFNQLDLPEYPSAAVLKTKLLQAVEMAHEGFGFI